MKTKKEIENCLTSDLRGMIYELETGFIEREDVFRFFVDILRDTEVDSKIIVKVLEGESFGTLGKEFARYIKVDEGW